MHILVVEDDPIIADILGMILEEAGYSPTIIKIDFEEHLTGGESIYEAPLLLSASPRR